MRFGLLLPNQGVVFGATTVPELLEMADVAEGSGAFDGLWVGDNLLAKPGRRSVIRLLALACLGPGSGQAAAIPCHCVGTAASAEGMRRGSCEADGWAVEGERVGQSQGRPAVPSVLRVGPYRFFFVSLDRDEPPHVHVQRENRVAKFWLDPIALQRAGGYNRSELKTIAALIQEHRDRLLESWHGFFGR